MLTTPFRGNSSGRLLYKPLSKVEKSRNHMIAAELNIRTRKALRKGEKNRSILNEYTKDGYEFSYHATKGLRRVLVGVS
jgi:hypothetical protein